MTPIRVLVADDQVDMRSSLSEVVLSHPSLELIGAAADAHEAVDLVRTLLPDVALLDVRMSGGGGPHAAREIRRYAPRTRVLAISADHDRDAVLEMVGAGAVGYLVKDASAREICDAIVASVQGASVLSPSVGAHVVRELRGHLERDAHVTHTRGTARARVERVLGGGGPEIVFQPIVELTTGRTVGVEALTSVQEPSGAAGLFAEAAEAGLRHELELAALRSALRRAGDLPRGMYLAVNLSPDVAVSCGLLELLGREHASRIVIEVTEHAKVADYKELARAIKPVRALGGQLAVDDAGAGYASLRHVLKLEPDIVKLDVTIVGDLEVSRGARALASFLVSFAETMGYLVIAEGVEAESTADLLRELGVWYAQGYHLGRPSTALPGSARG